MSEGDVLNIQGKYMNTSPEQLSITYIGIDRTDFESSARELVCVLDFDDHNPTEIRIQREEKQAVRNRSVPAPRVERDHRTSPYWDFSDTCLVPAPPRPTATRPAPTSPVPILLPYVTTLVGYTPLTRMAYREEK